MKDEATLEPDFRCRCEGVDRTPERTTVHHGRLLGVQSEPDYFTAGGTKLYVVGCSKLATQEDGFCDYCRSGHDIALRSGI